MKTYDKEYGHQTEEIEIPQELIFCDVFKILSGDAKLLYCCMLAVQQQEGNQKTDEDGKRYIEYPIQRIMKEFRCSERTAIRILEELDCKNGIGLLEKKRQGRGLPNRIYLKDFKEVQRQLESRR
ncbi:replication initiator protein A [Faecalimonas umbilicata]|uniref:replication initiator protein A n=1 Tax=Faecalimonas umbilicata TaxID=1912855 RepID=UPI0022DEA96D|nr:replication initiator protein A [Faecalimonas umbilicata]